jgi:suppressor of tumorigenicity protein 13
MYILEPDSEEPQPMGDAEKEVTEEDIENSEGKRIEAIEAFSDRKFKKAANICTEAILLNPGMAVWTIC